MALGAAASFLPDIRLSVSFVPSLPETVETRTAAGEAAAGFAAGVLSPTVLLVEGDGVADRRAALERLGDSVAARPGVAGVVGPGDLPIQLERRAVVAPSGDAARFLVVLSSEPLGATAMRDLDAVARALPRLGAGAGLTGVRYGLGGDTALASELVERTRADLGRITAAALAANLLLLALFLRALLTPVLLLGASVLGLCAALGALTYVSQEVIGNDGVTFYVPFAAAVLLLSLGSDYNIFGVGYVWERAVHMPFREALASAIPETSSAIGVAGVTLAASFAMLAVVPLQPFRELAFVMATGILLDALVVRALVVPALLTLLGGLSTWPRRPRAGPDAHPSRSPSPQP
jgi:RND superfamily putative drug exporter